MRRPVRAVPASLVYAVLTILLCSEEELVGLRARHAELQQRLAATAQ